PGSPTGLTRKLVSQNALAITSSCGPRSRARRHTSRQAGSFSTPQLARNMSSAAAWSSWLQPGRRDQLIAAWTPSAGGRGAAGPGLGAILGGAGAAGGAVWATGRIGGRALSLAQ